MTENVDLRHRAARRSPVADSAQPDAARAADAMAMIELLFFAYRDFTSDSDRILAEYDFGRAHHRVLHFVNRNPGLRVAALLSILKITKQSLARVLKQLLAQGFIEQRPGAEDRRERLLYATSAGQVLAKRLVQPQIARITAAVAAVEGSGAAAVEAFLAAMVDPVDRGAMLRKP